jgi:hypothetical protein
LKTHDPGRKVSNFNVQPHTDASVQPFGVTLTPDRGKKPAMEDGEHMATLDWSKCPAVESVPGRLSGAWVFRDTRMPVSAVFENLEAGATIEEIIVAVWRGTTTFAQ